MQTTLRNELLGCTCMQLELSGNLLQFYQVWVFPRATPTLFHGKCCHQKSSGMLLLLCPQHRKVLLQNLILLHFALPRHCANSQHQCEKRHKRLLQPDFLGRFMIILISISQLLSRLWGVMVFHPSEELPLWVNLLICFRFTRKQNLCNNLSTFQSQD